MAENPVLRSAYAVAEQAQQVKVNKDGIRAAGKQVSDLTIVQTVISFGQWGLAALITSF
jgi:hypothetical protein